MMTMEPGGIIERGQTPMQPEPLSFDVEFVNLYPAVVRSLSLILGDRHTAEDMTQEAFVRALVRWSQFESAEHVRRFVFKTSVNLARSRLRHLKVVQSAPLGEGQTLSLVDATSAVDDRILIQRALLALSWRQRTCLILMDLADLDAKTVGRMLRIRPSTAYVHLHRARRELRQELRKDSAETMEERDG
jgi:RNA polymerase sigma factor (sigma-70 family)